MGVVVVVVVVRDVGLDTTNATDTTTNTTTDTNARNTTTRQRSRAGAGAASQRTCCLVTAAHDVETRGHNVLSLTTLNKVVLNSKLEESLGLVDVVGVEVESGGDLANLLTPVDECDVARVLGTVEAGGHKVGTRLGNELTNHHRLATRRLRERDVRHNSVLLKDNTASHTRGVTSRSVVLNVG